MLNAAIRRLPQIDPSRYFQNLPEGFINMTYGAPIMEIFPPIHEAIKEAIHDRTYDLTPPTGLLSLREKIVNKLNNENGINCDINNITVTNGAHEGLGLLCSALLEPGDEVILFKPDWSIFDSFVKYYDCKSVFLEPEYTNSSLEYSIPKLEKLITGKTKLLILNTPQNPSGVVIPEKTIRQIVALCKSHGVYIIADEVYEKLVFDIPHFSAGAVEEKPKHVFTLHSFSKGFAMSGLRIGYMCGDSEMISKIADMKTAVSFSTNTLSQKAAIAALDSPKKFYLGMLENYQKKRLDLMKCFDDIGIKYIKPQGAFFILADYSHLGVDEISYRKLLDQTGVLTFPGSFFGTDNRYLRFSYSGSDTVVAQAIEALRTSR